MKITVKSLLLGLIISVLGLGTATAQRSLFHPVGGDRIRNRVMDEVRVTLKGNTHPMAQARFDLGSVDEAQPMNHMVLVLRASDAQQASLDALVAAQNNPNSPYYHQWLTPEQFGDLFGPSVADVAAVRNWLMQQGMSIDEITPSRRYIVFSGAAGAVRNAFGTEIHRYKVNGQMHMANVRDPQIPAALSSVVAGVLSLHDFQSASQSVVRSLGSSSSPMFTSGGSHYLAPDDFATIYNLTNLYNSGYDGSGQSIAVIARSNILMSDVRTFRSSHGLAANDPVVILNGATDPGVSNLSELTEASLDVEWAGAVARKATIKVVVTASTSTSDGAFLSAVYAVNNNVAPIITMSFGLCEKSMGSSGNAFINSLWQQAAAQGISVFVSSGDSGAAGCDSASASTSVNAAGVNGICSTPYSTCVGGSQFNDTANPSAYWSTTNSSSRKSALSYIPEIAWNESASSGLLSTGGGPSSIYAKPSWQSASGVPSDGKRDTPDVSLTASVHDGYLIYFNGILGVAGGTSASAPAFAGIMALVNQKIGSAQGLANPYLYRMASNQYANAAYNVFHDVTSGNNSVPGLTGFSAGAGYDMATGLGSVDVAQLLQNWGSGSTTSTASFSLGVSSASLLLAAASSNALTVTASPSGGFNSAVGLTVSGLPAGVTASFAPSSIASGTGSSTLTLVASSAVAAGSYAVTITGVGGSLTKTASFTLTTTAAAGYTLGLSSSTLSLASGASNTLTVSSTAAGSFNSAVSLTASGLPTGVTASFAPSSIAGGAGSSTLTLTASSTVAAGSYAVTITGVGGSLTRTASFTLTTTAAGSFTLTAASSTLQISSGSGTDTLTIGAVNGFSSSVSLAVTGAPAGVTLSLTPSTISGAGASTLKATANASAAPGSYAITVTAVSGSITRTLSLILNVPGIVLATGSRSGVYSIQSGGSISVSVLMLGGFNSACTLSVSGLPYGVTAKIATPTITYPGGSTLITLTSSGIVRNANMSVVVTATGGGVTKSLTVPVSMLKTVSRYH